MNREKTLSEKEFKNEISPDFIGDNPRKMKEGTITPIVKNKTLSEKSVGVFISGRKELLDWRNLPFKTRLKICYNLLFFGIVDIEWKKQNIKELK